MARDNLSRPILPHQHVAKQPGYGGYQQQQNQYFPSPGGVTPPPTTAPYQQQQNQQFSALNGGAPSSTSAPSLSDVLRSAKLEQYSEAITDAGCVESSDLLDMADQELIDLGMKLAQVKRLRRKLATV